MRNSEQNFVKQLSIPGDSGASIAVDDEVAARVLVEYTPGEKKTARTACFDLARQLNCDESPAVAPTLRGLSAHIVVLLSAG